MISDSSALSNYADPVVIKALKLLQILTTGIGMFLSPAIVAAILFSYNPFHYLCLKMPNAALSFIIIIFIMIAAVPAINFLVAINQQMHLPAFLSGVEQWMKTSEQKCCRINKSFCECYYGPGPDL